MESLSTTETAVSKNTPQLRFPEFAENWKKQYLSSHLDFKNGINASKEMYGSGYKFINVLDIIQNDYITHERIKGKVEISDDVFKKNIVEYGDILFQRSSETREEVGQSNVYLDIKKPATFGGFVIRGKKIGEYNPVFFHHLLKTSIARKKITSKSGGSTRFNIGQNILSSIDLRFPDLDEQQKIANFLTQVDRKVELLDKQQAALEQYKKGVMQKIFNQEIRFKIKNEAGELVEPQQWEEKKLGEICDKAKSGGTPKSSNKKYYDGVIPFLAISDMTKQGKYLKRTSKHISKEGIDNSASWIVPENSLIYSMYASVGFVCINKIEIATSQAVMNLILKSNENLEYVYYFLSYFKRFINKYVETGTQGNINARIVKNINIKYPSNQEQTKIANFLSAIDTKIEAIAERSRSHREWKKGLLQKMFI